MGEQTARPPVSVVIPVLNAAPYLSDLFAAFARQDPCPPDEVILVDSGSTDGTAALAARAPGVRVVPIERFSHGRSRNLGARAAAGEIVVFLSQDALPADERWLAELVAAFDDPRVAAAYSRQIPRPDRFPRTRVEGGAHRLGQIRLDVVPLLRNLVIRQNDLQLFHNPSPF